MVKKLFWILPALLLMGCGETAPEPPAPGETEAILAELCAPYEEEGLRWESAGDCVVSESGAEQTFTLTYTGAEAFAAGLADEVEAALAARMEEVTFASELCEEGTYRADVLEEAWETALSARQADPAAYETSEAFTLCLLRGEEGWRADSAPEIASLSEALAAEKAKLAELVPPRKIYRLDPTATVGPVPAGEYIVTDDPAEIDALLQRSEAQALLNGRSTVWDSSRERKEGTSAYAYLDETILALVWQERQVPATVTFAEVFIADASQLIRKLADDTYGSNTLIVPTDFARATNAVMLTDGDFYRLRGGYGINVYQGRILQANGSVADSCFFDREGNMLFARGGELATPEAVEQFVKENDIWTGLSFGPVMVENGENVCPDYYAIGDYIGELARCSIAQVDELHYMVAATDYYFSVSELADLLIQRGAQSAYNIDGGQSSAIILLGEQRNQTVFGAERAQSDCLFFASALPEA